MMTRALGLDASEIDDFFEIGWIARRALFDADEIARMRCCFEALERLAGSMRETGLRSGSYFVLGAHAGARVIKRVVWAGGSQRYLLDVGADPRLTVPSAQLLGSASMDQLLSQAHFKQPHDGVRFDWHQDIEHRDKGAGTWRDVNGRGSYVQTLIAVDPMRPDSGPLKFIDGSTRWGRLDPAGDQDARDVGRAASAATRLGTMSTITADPGDVLFFGPYAVHASFENRSSRPRRVLINGYASPGANRRKYPGAGAGRRLTAPVDLWDRSRRDSA